MTSEVRYFIKSSRVGKAKEVSTIPEVVNEVVRILVDREHGMKRGKIIIEAK